MSSKLTMRVCAIWHLDSFHLAGKGESNKTKCRRRKKNQMNQVFPVCERAPYCRHKSKLGVLFRIRLSTVIVFGVLGAFVPLVPNYMRHSLFILISNQAPPPAPVYEARSRVFRPFRSISRQMSGAPKCSHAASPVCTGSTVCVRACRRPDSLPQ